MLVFVSVPPKTKVMKIAQNACVGPKMWSHRLTAILDNKIALCHQICLDTPCPCWHKQCKPVKLPNACRREHFFCLCPRKLPLRCHKVTVIDLWQHNNRGQRCLEFVLKLKIYLFFFLKGLFNIFDRLGAEAFGSVCQ